MGSLELALARSKRRHQDTPGVGTCRHSANICTHGTRKLISSRKVRGPGLSWTVIFGPLTPSFDPAVNVSGNRHRLLVPLLAFAVKTECVPRRQTGLKRDETVLMRGGLLGAAGSNRRA